jgi:hypothetical protein
MKSPNGCFVAGASVGYQIPIVSGTSTPLAIFASPKPTLAANAEAAKRTPMLLITATRPTATSVFTYSAGEYPSTFQGRFISTLLRYAQPTGGKFHVRLSAAWCGILQR